MEAKEHRTLEEIFLMTFLILVFIGSLAVVSASWYISAQGVSNIPIKHLFSLLAGAVAFLFLSRIDYHFYRRLPIWSFALLAIGFLCLPFLFGRASHGAQRWIYLGPFAFQPFEISKILLVIYLALVLSNLNREEGFFKQIFVPFLPVVPSCILLLLQPHFGASALLVTITFLMLFLAGAKTRYILITAFLVLLLGGALLLSENYRAQRLLASFQADPYGKGYQQHQSLIAIGSGGLTGRGFGSSVAKLGYLPEAHTDFIFAIVAEEGGFLASLFIMSVFLLFICLGYQIALSSKDMLGKLLAGGLISLLAVQVGVNLLMVSVPKFPVVGLPLPFFSYGGSSTISSFASVGIILNIAKINSRRGLNYEGIDYGRRHRRTYISRSLRGGNIAGKRR